MTGLPRHFRLELQRRVGDPVHQPDGQGIQVGIGEVSGTVVKSDPVGVCQSVRKRFMASCHQQPAHTTDGSERCAHVGGKMRREGKTLISVDYP